jgi:S1-C subfamily serine protease
VTVNDEVRPSLGDLRISSGVLVAARTPSSTLLGEGPQPGDVIHAINGSPVHDLTQLKQELRRIKAGDPIVLQIERSGTLSYLVLETE